LTETWDEGVSLQWLQSFLIYKYRRQLLERNLAHWGNPRVILEAGSGPAHDSILFAEHGAIVTAIDSSLPGIRAAQHIYTERALPIRAICANILALPFPNDQFDLTWNAGTLEHFERNDDVLRALEEMARVTRRGGTVLVLVPNRRYFWYQWHLERMRRRCLKHQYDFERAFNAEEMQTFFARAGLREMVISGDHIHPSPEFLIPHTGHLTATLRWLFAPIEKRGDSRWKAFFGLDVAIWGRKA
jgi:SAM-dependent methyltransferase